MPSIASRVALFFSFALGRGTHALTLQKDHQSSAESLGSQSLVSSKKDTSADPLALAERFESPQCQDAIAKAKGVAWAKIIYPDSPHLLGNRTQEVFLNPDLRVAYIRNQKAGSTYMEQNLAALFNHPGFEEHAVDLGTDPKRQDYKPSELTNDWFVFSMVREPLTTAFAAYLEVDRKRDVPDNLPKSVNIQPVDPTYRHIDCGNKEARTLRFKTYLKEIQKQHHLGCQAFHSFPQALKINVHKDPSREKTFDGIAKLEAFQGGLRAVQALARAKNRQQITFAMAEAPPVPDEAAHGPVNTNKLQGCADVDFEDKELLRLVCDIYKVDYECFDYARPSVCP